MYVFLQNHREFKELLIFLDSMFLISQHCSYALVRFRHKNHLVRVQKTLWFGLKRLFWSKQVQLEMSQCLVLNTWFSCHKHD